MSAASVGGLMRLLRATLAAGIAGFGALLVAIAVASARFRECGPSSFDAAVAACRLGAQVLAGAYVLLSIALVLGAACLSLVWRLRRRRQGR